MSENEEERARRFVERHFPKVTRFLAAERGEGLVPTFGPTELQNVHDDTGPTYAIVRVEFAMSRAELETAMSYGYAEANHGRPPEDMTVEEIRKEIEGYLAYTGALEMFRHVEAEQRRTIPPADQPHIDALNAALYRAYPPHREPEPAPVQAPRYGDGTVTLQTLDHGEITIDEPVWCTGHDGEPVVQRVDVTHVGATVAAELETDGGTVEFLPARISWGPFAELRPEPYPLADVDDFPGLDPAQLRELAAEVGTHAGRLYTLANQLDRIRRAES